MHAKAIEIAWHDNTSIWSVDLSAHNRLITAGGDRVARMWRLHKKPHAKLSSLPSKASNSALAAVDSELVVWQCDLRAHTTTVNVARFSHDGFSVATGADMGEIVLWRYEEGMPGGGGMMEIDAPAAKERWARVATLRGHVQDVLDVAWSADGSRLVSASIDNAVMVWDVRQPAKPPVTLRNHANFVQGVAIDPLGRLITSMGNDRALRVFTASNSNNWYQVASLSTIGEQRLFVDDGRGKNLFRRLAWSPDGSVVACPSGMHFPTKKGVFAVHLFARNQWFRPAVQCGGLTKPAICVKFSPILYDLRGKKTETVIDIDAEPAAEGDAKPSERARTPFDAFSYRMIFAVVCIDSVLFYDTEALTKPFAVVEGLHVADNTDVSWSADGLNAAVSSVDGYISLTCFTPEEIGTPLAPENTPAWVNRQEEIRNQYVSKSSYAPKNTTVTLVRPQPVTRDPAASLKVVVPKPKPIVQEPIPCPLPIPFPESANAAKAMVSSAQSISELTTSGATVTKTVGSGFRISLSNPANQEKSTLLATDSKVQHMRDSMSEELEASIARIESDRSAEKTDANGKHIESSNEEASVDQTANDRRAAKIEVNAMPVYSWKEREGASTDQTKNDSNAESIGITAKRIDSPKERTGTAVDQTESKKVSEETDVNPKGTDFFHERTGAAVAAQQPTDVNPEPRVITSPRTAVCVDPESPLQSCLAKAGTSPKSRPTPIDPSKSAPSENVRRDARLEVAKSNVATVQPKKRQKKVQTTLFSFKSPNAIGADRPRNKQFAFEPKAVSRDSMGDNVKPIVPQKRRLSQRPGEKPGTTQRNERSVPVTDENNDVAEAKRRKTDNENVVDLT